MLVDREVAVDFIPFFQSFRLVAEVFVFLLEQFLTLKLVFCVFIVQLFNDTRRSLLFWL